MHKADFFDRIKLNKNGVIIREVTAEWKDRKAIVYRETENGEYFSRYLYTSYYGGYFVLFEGETQNSSYFGRFTQEREKLTSCRELNIGSSIPCEKDKNVVLEKYPDFKYIFNKYEVKSNSEIIELLKLWKEHKEIEFPLSLNLPKIAKSKSFYKLKNSQKKEFFRYLYENKDFIQKENLSVLDIKKILKKKLSHEDFLHLMELRRYTKLEDLRAVNYLKNHYDFTYSTMCLYRDYIDIIRELKKDTKDLYWLCPKNLKESHDKALTELNEIKRQKEELRRIEWEKKEKERIRKENEKKKKLNAYCKREHLTKEEAEKLYSDYVFYSEKLNKNYEEEPSNLKETASKLKKEYEEMKNKERYKKLQKLEKALAPYVEYNTEIDGFKIFVSSDYETWLKQAEDLHQCIVRIDYMGRVINKNCIIVFMYDEKGKPYATAEIKKNGVIGQFYTDEHLPDYYPSEKAKIAMNKYLENLKNQKVKIAA